MAINLFSNSNHSVDLFKEKIAIHFYFSDNRLELVNLLEKLYNLKKRFEQSATENNFAVILKTNRNFDPGMLFIPFRFNYTLTDTNQYYILSIQGDRKWAWTIASDKKGFVIINNGTVRFDFETNTFDYIDFKPTNITKDGANGGANGANEKGGGADGTNEKVGGANDVGSFFAIESTFKTNDKLKLDDDIFLKIENPILLLDATQYFCDKINLILNTTNYLFDKFNGKITVIIYLNKTTQTPIPDKPYKLLHKDDLKILIFLGYSTFLNGVFITNHSSAGLLEIPEKITNNVKSNYKSFNKSIFTYPQVPHKLFYKQK